MLLDWTDPHAPLSTEFTNAHELTIFHFTAGFRNCASVLEIIGAGPAAVIDWLKGGDAFTVSNVSTLPALGTSALAVDFDVTGKCADVEVPFFTSADGTGVNVLLPGHHFRIVVADVAGTTITALLDGPKSDFPVFAPEARRLLESVRFDGT